MARAQDRTDLAGVVERVTMLAVAAMERWRRTVRALPWRAGSDEQRMALCGLSAWYERLCVDRQYAMAGPTDAIEALRSGQMLTARPSEELVIAWWAVHLAEEVVDCRRLLRSGDDAQGIDLEVAVTRLEVALHGGHERLRRVPA